MNNHFTVLNFDEVGSTNDLAFKLIQENSAHNNFIITAKSQTKGRGRQDRQWDSPEGNLYFSLILQVEDPKSVTNYSFLAACVIGDVLKSYGIETHYKWPNDIMLNGKKLAGVLLQLQKINNVNNLVIGVGLNLTSCPDYAVCLKDYDISREAFLEKFEKVFLDYEESHKQFGFISIRQRWKDKAYKIGEEVALSNGMKGVFKDVDESGNLVLLDGDGIAQKVCVAEIL